MNNHKLTWKQQILHFDADLLEALQQQHHAAQFMALVGRHLIPQKPDDSNTNMRYELEKEMLVGNDLSNGISVALQLNDLILLLLDKENNIKNEILLVGKTKAQVFEELKQSLSESQIDVTKFINEIHYEIPEHKLDKGAVFTIEDKKYFLENTVYRNNAEIIINEIASGFINADPVRVWPHHFDTGIYYPVSYNKKGEVSQSIGIGLAIPDSMINEPYYYLSFWSENLTEGLEKSSPLDVGEWMMPTWKGAVLKHLDILKFTSPESQLELVKSFFNSGIKILIDQFNL